MGRRRPEHGHPANSLVEYGIVSRRMEGAAPVAVYYRLTPRLRDH